MSKNSLRHISHFTKAVSTIWPNWLKPKNADTPVSLLQLLEIQNRLNDQRISLKSLHQQQSETLLNIRATLKSTVTAAELVNLKGVPVEMSVLLNRNSNSLDLIDFKPLTEQCDYCDSLLKALSRTIDELKLHVEAAGQSNSKLRNCLWNLKSGLLDMELMRSRINQTEKEEVVETEQTRQKEVVRKSSIPSGVVKKIRKRVPNQIFNTPAEAATEEIVTILSKRGIYPDPLVSTLNSNCNVFVINSCDATNDFMSTVLQVSAKNNSMNVVGMDVEFWMDTPATIQIAFSAEIVAIFQLRGICGNRDKPEDSDLDVSKFPSGLKKFLESPNRQKTGVGIYQDTLKVLKAFRIQTANLSDLGRIAESIGVGSRSLVSIYFAFVDPTAPFKKVDKSATGFNWNALELETAAIEYSANDALASLLSHRAMVNQTSVNSVPWQKNSPSTTFNSSTEERNWQEFSTVLSKYELRTNKPPKSARGSLPSSLPNESDMVLSFTELPSDLVVSNSNNSRPSTQQSMATSTDDIAIKADMIQKWNSKMAKSKKITATTMQAIPLEFERAMFQALLADSVLSTLIKNNKPVNLFSIAKQLVGQVWDSTERHLDSFCSESDRERVQAILSIKSVNARLLVVFEVIDMWFNKNFLTDYQSHGPTGLVNRELAIEAPKRDKQTNRDILFSGLETLPVPKQSVSSDQAFQPSSKLKEELILNWNRVNPRLPISPSVSHPPIPSDFEVALFRAVIASGKLHGYISHDHSNSDATSVYLFYLIKVIGSCWGSVRAQFSSTPSSTALMLMDLESTKIQYKSAVSINVICTWLEHGFLSRLRYLDGGVPIVVIGSRKNAASQAILRELGPAENKEIPELSLKKKSIKNICNEYNSLDADKVAEWKLLNFKFCVEIKRFEMLNMAFERKFGGNVDHWNLFFDSSFQSEDWSMEANGTLRVNNVGSRLKTVQENIWSYPTKPIALTKIYSIIELNKHEFGVLHQ